MACSKYISTKETTHSARVSRLLLDPCTDLLRDILRNQVTEIQFPGILQKEQCNLNPILNKVQRQLLYPSSGRYFSGTYKEFDLSLLYILLRNISGITPHHKGWAHSPDQSDRSLSANIDRLREIRNTYCGHAANISLSDIAFQKLWQDLTVIISELECYLPGGCSTYTDAANMIKTDTMDPDQEKRLLDIIDKQHQSTQDLKETQHRQQIEIEKVKQEQSQQQTERQSEQQMQRIELLNLSTNIARLEKLSDSERKNILENTLAVLKAQWHQKVNVRTTGEKTITEKLRSSHIAILTGKRGAGKTTTALQIMIEMSDSSLESPFTPVLINSPEQWDKVIYPNGLFIVYLDDFIGSTNLDTSAVEKWKNHLDVIFSCARTGNVKVLIGLRSNILNEARKYFTHALFADANVVDLSSEVNFTMKDKEEMFKAYEENCNFEALEPFGISISDNATRSCLNVAHKMSDYEKSEILHADSYYGFPLTCFQFFSRNDFYHLGASYFQHPDENLLNVIDSMRRSKFIENVKYCVLCYVFIHGSIELNSSSLTLLKTICEKLRIFNVHEVDIKDAISDLNGLFLSNLKTVYVYECSHETIVETVMVSFGQVAPDIVIKRCSKEKLHELIRTENYEPKPGEVVLKIPRDYYEDLAQRLFRGDDGDGKELMDIQQVALGIVLHPGCDDPEFVSVLCNREISDRLYSLFQCLWNNNLVFSFLTEKKLFLELLERYGPQREQSVRLVRRQVSFFHIMLHHFLGDIYKFFTSHQEEKEKTFYITKRQIKKALEKTYYAKSVFRTLLLFICKYPDLQGLLHIRICADVKVLHYCIIHGWEDLVDMILTKNTSSNAPDLWSFFLGEREDLYDWMFERSEPLKTIDELSCVHIAAYAGRFFLLQKFINLGHDITIRTSEGFSVLQTTLLGLRYGHQTIYCSFANNSKFFKYERLFKYITLSFPDSKMFIEVINVLLLKNKKCNTDDLSMDVDENGNNIIHYLVMHDLIDILDCLLKYDMALAFRRNNSELPTSLHIAVYLGRTEMVKKLSKVGVCPLDSDLSLTETCLQGEKFCNRVLTYIDSKSSVYNFCWSDGNDKVLNLKLKAIPNVTIVFGRNKDFQNIRDFLSDTDEVI